MPTAEEIAAQRESQQILDAISAVSQFGDPFGGAGVVTRTLGDPLGPIPASSAPSRGSTGPKQPAPAPPPTQTVPDLIAPPSPLPPPASPSGPGGIPLLGSILSAASSVLPSPRDVGGLRFGQTTVMSAERIIERSGDRQLRAIFDKLQRDSSLLRTAAVIASRVSVVVGGLFTPTTLGRGDIPLAEVAIPRQIKRLQTPNVPELGVIDRPALEALEVPDFQRRALRQIERSAPAGRPKPSRGPKRSPVPGSPTLPSTSSRALQRVLTGIGTAAVASRLISRSVQTRGARTRQPFIDPVFPPQGIPLTPAQPTPLPSPSPSPLRPRTQEDVCRDLARRRRKKQRKCDQRENVVWAGGPSKGKIAGTKCFKFRG